MKKGDKLLCKKDYINMKKGFFYEISNISENHINIIDYTFATKTYVHNFAWEYFYTEKELRILKLESL